MANTAPEREGRRAGTLEGAIAAIPQAALDGLTKIVTHAGCPDGIASAMLLRAAFPELPVEFVYHGTPEHRQPPCAALFCDFAPPPETAAEWRDAGAVVLDHHATARQTVELFDDRGVFADEKAHPGVSGAWLALLLVERLTGDGSAAHPVVRNFARLVGVRDTWQRGSAEWDEAGAVASALTLWPVETLLEQPCPTPSQVAAGRVLYQRRLAKAKKTAASLAAFSQDGTEFLFFNDSLDKLSSDVGEAARELGRAVDFVAGFFYTDAGQLVFSMRSVADGFDVGAIATANGGGGHTRAAGFQCNDGFVVAPIEALRRALARPR